MGNTYWIRELATQCLSFGQRNTHQIYDYINNNYKYGTSMQSLTNALVFDRRILKVGKDKVEKFTGGFTEIALWSLKPGSEGKKRINKNPNMRVV